MKSNYSAHVLILGAVLLCSHIPSSFGRDPALWPFDAGDPWNIAIGSKARYAPVEKGFFNTSGGKAPNGTILNCLRYSMNVYQATPDDPLCLVRTWHGDSNGQFNGKVRAPREAKPSLGTDGHMIIIDETRRHAVEMGLVKRDDLGHINSWAAFKNDLTGSGFFAKIHGVRAHGGSALGGLIRKGELTRGIPHVLALATERANLNSRAPDGKTYVWPACSSDYEFPASLWPPGKKPYRDWYGKSGNLFVGTLLAIPPDIDIDKIGIGTSGPTYEIAKALQDYGGYIVDMAGAPLVFYAEPAAAEEIGGVEALKKTGGGSALKLAKLLPYLRIVTNNSPESIGGGGKPRRPPAPPFDPEFLKKEKK